MSLGGHRFIAGRDLRTGFDVYDIRIPSVAQKSDNCAGVAPLFAHRLAVHFEKQRRVMCCQRFTSSLQRLQLPALNIDLDQIRRGQSRSGDVVVERGNFNALRNGPDGRRGEGPTARHLWSVTQRAEASLRAHAELARLDASAPIAATDISAPPPGPAAANR